VKKFSVGLTASSLVAVFLVALGACSDAQHPRQTDGPTELALTKFQARECIEIQQALILASLGGASNRTQITFGTAK
jgi:hypothetical protein